MEPPGWVHGGDRYGKGLLWRPRRDRVEDYTLRVFDAACTHAQAIRAFGGSRRIVAALLIEPDGRFDALPWWSAGADCLADIVERLDPKLTRREDDVFAVHVKSR